MSKEISQRIADDERLKNKRAKYWGGTAKDSDKSLGCVKDTPTPCSCWMCGNPRKYFGEKTIQEQSFEQTEKFNEN